MYIYIYVFLHIYLNGYQAVLSVIFPLKILTLGMSQILGRLQGGVQLHIGADGGQRLLLSHLATDFSWLGRITNQAAEGVGLGWIYAYQLYIYI